MQEGEGELEYTYAETGATSRELTNPCYDVVESHDREKSYELPVSPTSEPTRPNIYAVPEFDQQVRALLHVYIGVDKGFCWGFTC